MANSHLFHLAATKPQKSYPGGMRIDAQATNFPALSGMAASLLTINPKCMREPHWHPNASELSYCLEGQGLMTIFSPHAEHDTFTIRPGEIVFVPQGSLHHIENIGDTPLKLLLCFDNDKPEDLDISTSMSVMPGHILAATFSMKSTYFDNLPDRQKATFIAESKTVTKPVMPYIVNRFKMDLEGILPQVNTAGGWVKMSNSFLLPPLDGLAIYSLMLKAKGAREPHWHPNASELNYLMQGQARITLLSPSGQVDTFDLKPGDISFMPKGYFHHIENTGSEDVRFAIFFNHKAPSDIGLTGCFGAYSNEVFASLFGLPASFFDPLPKYQQDLFVVHGGG